MAPRSAEAEFQIRRGEAILGEREARRRSLRATAERVAALLRDEFGATRVWNLGSLCRPWFHAQSDVDLAVEGVPADRRARAWDRTTEVADGPVDLVFLEEADPLLRERVLADGEALGDP